MSICYADMQLFISVIVNLEKLMFSMKRPPLYHYTSQVGMLGMAQHKSLWLTNILYMNDSEEYFYGLTIIKEVILEFYDDYLLSRLNSHEVSFQKYPTQFSFSLSESKDLLSQWRGYCPNGGASLEISDETIQFILNENDNFRIEKCIYQREEIAKLVIDNIVQISPDDYKLEAEMEKERGPNKARSRRPSDIIEKIFYYLPFIKHPGFSEEKEWRIVNTPHYNQPMSSISNEISFRPGKRGLIPYLDISLKNAPRIFNSAILSPNDTYPSSLESVKLAMSIEDVKGSEIPYLP